MKPGPRWKRRGDQTPSGKPNGQAWGEDLVRSGVTASLTVLVMLVVMGLNQPSTVNATPLPMGSSPASVHDLAPWAFNVPHPSKEPDEPAVVRPDRTTPRRLLDRVVRSSSMTDRPAPIATGGLPQDLDRGGPGVRLLPRFSSERNAMERMRAEVACTAVCSVQAVVAPKGYLTVHLNAMDHMGRVTLDDPTGWSVTGYYLPGATGLVPTLRVEDTGTLAGRPPRATWLRVRTTTRTLNVRVSPESQEQVALPDLQVNDADEPGGDAVGDWFQTPLGVAGL